MKFKNGDRLYCHTRCIMSGSSEICTVIGRYYIIEYVNTVENEFYIYDEQHDCHYFRIDNYKKYFYCDDDIKDIRKKKINILNGIK